MPIKTSIPLKRISQAQFSQVAYEVVGHAIEIRKQFGRMFHESAYRNTVAHILGQRANEEVCLQLTHGDFEKRYFIDLVVDCSAPFELKVTSALNDRHRRQLIQYLMLTNLQHGKLINFGTGQLEHEFVNCLETIQHRQSFRVDDSRWLAGHPHADRFHDIVVGLLRDWGTGLDLGLYTEAVTHFFGGVEVVKQHVDVLWQGEVVSRQIVNLVGEACSFEITCLRRNMSLYEQHLSRMLANTSLERILWVNIVSGTVTFVTLAK